MTWSIGEFASIGDITAPQYQDTDIYPEHLIDILRK